MYVAKLHKIRKEKSFMKVNFKKNSNYDRYMTDSSNLSPTLAAITRMVFRGVFFMPDIHFLAPSGAILNLNV